MMLGIDECDEEMGYFLTYGKNKPYKRTCRVIPPEGNEEELYREFQEANFNEYFTGSYKYCLFK